MIDFLKLFFSGFFMQVFCLMGPILFFGFLLFFLSKFYRNIFAKTVGTKVLLFLTGWVGVPVHELSHALMCLIFRHQISEIKLFNPSAKDGTLGYVNHVYKKSNLYQVIGNFFIGIAPLVIGATIIFLLLFFLFPEKSLTAVFKAHTQIRLEKFSDIIVVFKALLASIFSIDITGSAHFSAGVFILLFLVLSISAHMELSPSDIKGSLKGMFFLLIILLLIQLIFQLSGLHAYVIKAQSLVFVGLTDMFLISFVASAFVFLVGYLLLSIIYFLKHGALLNPFSSK